MAHSIDFTQIYPTPLLHQTTKYEIEDGEINGQDRTANLRTHKSVNQIFHERFVDLDNLSIQSTTIFKVSVDLRESNPDAYVPKLVSIGPYHKKNPQLVPMEKYKLVYLRRFLQRKEGTIDVESCIREMEKLKDDALKCYDDIDNDDKDKFSEMLLLDGCFVVEFIRDCIGLTPIREGEQPFPMGGGLDHPICRDLLLLENQLPFFVLTKLHDMSKHQGEPSFTKQVKWTVVVALPKVTPAAIFYDDESEGNTKDIKHLLQVLHMSCHPSSSLTKTEVEHYSRKTWNPLRIIRARHDDMPKDNYKDILSMGFEMPNATELFEAGVRFSKVGYNYSIFELQDNRGDSTSLFDIKFENGLMEIPCFEVFDGTEATLRNLIAYEQHFQPDATIRRYFSHFATFMDYLIESEKDVSLLRQKGIIRNHLGEDKEIASLFNKIGKGINLDPEFYFKEECWKATQYCEKPWNRMKANLRHNYFNSPWAGISTAAAIILLLLTVTQTVLSFITVFK